MTKLYNKRLGRQWRAGVIANNPPGFEIDELRASGRTTGRVLAAIGLALQNPMEWIEISDHTIEPGKPVPQHVQDRMANEVMSYVAKLGLQFFEKRVSRKHIPASSYSRMVSEIRCASFTTNPWEIV